MRIDSDLYELAERLGQALLQRQQLLATAESCTGGLVAGAITAVAGSSAWFERGFVTYTNEAKTELLGLPRQTLDTFGAVSIQTAEGMSQGALAFSRAQWAVAVTGIAGPGGGSAEKPVGLVHFAAAKRGGNEIAREMRFGDIGRSAVRERAVLVALEMLAEVAG